MASLLNPLPLKGKSQLASNAQMRFVAHVECSVRVVSQAISRQELSSDEATFSFSVLIFSDPMPRDGFRRA
jgi:hypothetical protein